MMDIAGLAGQALADKVAFRIAVKTAAAGSEAAEAADSRGESAGPALVDERCTAIRA
ncbi:MAG: hypothetical protein LBK04_07090 [Clostridiales Family XIII bacterium]|nr:hypothetical protein [Clostridiales Family XIII bacterium]